MQDPSLVVMLALLAVAWLLSVAMYAHACRLNRREDLIYRARGPAREGMPVTSVALPPAPALAALAGEPYRETPKNARQELERILSLSALDTAPGKVASNRWGDG